MNRRIQPIRLAVPLAAAAALLVVLASCRRSDRRIAPEEAAPHTVAVVNNERIGYEEFQRAYGEFLAHWDSLLIPAAGQKREVRDLVLQQLVTDKLMDQEARRRGIQISDDDVRARVQALVAPADLSDLRQSASGHGTLQDWLHAYERRLIREKLIRQEVIDKLRITPKEERDYYTKNARRFRQAEEVKVRQLCVTSRDVYDRVVKALAEGEDFAKLIRRYSITPDRQTDGDLGYVQRGVLPLPLEQAVFENRRSRSIVAPRSRPVQSEMGFHAFRVEGYRPEGIQPFEDARQEIHRLLEQEREAEAYQRWLDQLRSNATITIDTTLLNSEAG